MWTGCCISTLVDVAEGREQWRTLITESYILTPPKTFDWGYGMRWCKRWSENNNKRIRYNCRDEDNSRTIYGYFSITADNVIMDLWVKSAYKWMTNASSLVDIQLVYSIALNYKHYTWLHYCFIFQFVQLSAHSLYPTITSSRLNRANWSPTRCVNVCADIFPWRYNRLSKQYCQLSVPSLSVTRKSPIWKISMNVRLLHINL